MSSGHVSDIVNPPLMTPQRSSKWACANTCGIVPIWTLSRPIAVPGRPSRASAEAAKLSRQHEGGRARSAERPSRTPSHNCSPDVCCLYWRASGLQKKRLVRVYQLGGAFF